MDKSIGSIGRDIGGQPAENKLDLVTERGLIMLQYHRQYYLCWLWELE